MSMNHLFHDKMKHIEIRYHYIRDMVRKGAVKLPNVPIDDQTADILTKPLLRTKLITFAEDVEQKKMHPSWRGKVKTDIYIAFTLVPLLVLDLILVWEKSHRHCEMGR